MGVYCELKDYEAKTLRKSALHIAKPFGTSEQNIQKVILIKENGRYLHKRKKN